MRARLQMHRTRRADERASVRTGARHGIMMNSVVGVSEPAAWSRPGVRGLYLLPASRMFDDEGALRPSAWPE